MPLKDIGPFRVVDTLGSGGAGTVYRAVDRRNNETVAVKLLRVGFTRDPRSARRLAREFDALARLSHPNVVRVYETGVHEGYPFLAMELVEGLTLRSYLSLSGPSASTPRPSLWALEDESDTGVGARGAQEEEDSSGAFDLAAFAEEPPSEELGGRTELAGGAASRTDSSFGDGWLDVPAPLAPAQGGSADAVEALNRPERVARLKEAMVQLTEALAYIHSHGLVHRDLKPTNVMVDEDRVVRLMDFGLAKFLADEANLTQEGRQVGTFRYMSPEQILGEPLDARTDLYSLGVLLYELLAGRPPFDGKTPDALWDQVLEVEPPPLMGLNRNVDPQLARIAHRLLRKEPEQRYQTAEEVYEALVE